MNKLFLGGLLISTALHLAVALWFYLQAPELWESMSLKSSTPLSVKLTTSVAIAKQPSAPLEPSEISTKVEQMVELVEAETRVGSPSDEVALAPSEAPSAVEIVEPGPVAKIEPKAETLDLSASRFSVSEFNLSASQEANAKAGGSSQTSFSGVFDPRLRQRLQAGVQNQTTAEPDSFEIMNNRSLSNGSERVSFGEACFEITDAIGGGTNEKQVFRTNCLGNLTLSERIMENVKQRLKEKQGVQNR